MTQKRIVDKEDVKQIDIVQVANDLGLNVHKRGSLWVCECPNPGHVDTHIGNFVLQTTRGKNRFKCFACGIVGNPIDLYMLVKGVDFLTALYDLADIYNIGQVIDTKNLDKKTREKFIWDGLNAEEYEFFGLKTISDEIPIGIDNNNNIIFDKILYSMKDLRIDDPDYHDFLLINKFKEKVFNVGHFLNLMENGFFLKYDLELFWMNENWFNACVSLIEKSKKLLYKGLKDKNKYFSVVKENKNYKKAI